MAVKISELPVITPEQLSDDDVIPIVDLNPLGTPRTKRINLTGLFTKAPVKSVNGLSSGDISLASTDLTDSSTIGRILSVNGKSGEQVSLGSGDLNDSTDIVLKSNLGTIDGFTNEYNSPTSSELQTEYEQLARLLGQDQKNVRLSLFSVQQTANNALPSSVASTTYATKSSLGNYVTSSSLTNNYYNKSDSDNKYATRLSLGTYATSSALADTYATKEYVTNQINQSSGANVSVFNVAGLNASGNASIGGSLLVSNNLSVNAKVTCEDFTALDLLSGLRAEIGDGTANQTRLTIKGDADVQGNLTCNSVEVQGQMKIHSSQVVEIEDDFIEVNRKQDGTTTAGVSGFHINRGASIEKAELSWDNSVSIWQFKVGGNLANLRANNLVTTDVFGTMEEFQIALENALS
jgi:hypothetical protein